MKITSLELENIKRIKAVKMEPAQNGLTIIGGKNGQGKTSVLDAIMWALGGDRYKPAVPNRTNALTPASIHITMDNGLVVERHGKTGALKVIDSTGKKSGQKLLNEFISQLAIDLPAFLKASNKEKAETLLQIIGVGPQLATLEAKEKALYFQRTEIGRIRDIKKKSAENMETFPDAPEKPISISDLIQEQQIILAKNGENQRKRFQLSQLQSQQTDLANRIREVSEQLARLQADKTKVDHDIETAEKDVATLKDESTAEIEKSISRVELINKQIQANVDHAKAEKEADEYAAKYAMLTSSLQDVRDEKKQLLDNAALPLPGLSVEEGVLTYKGIPWDGMSSSEQLKVAAAIARQLNPKCGFVLMDKLEQMDIDTLKEFGTWLEKEGLQVIATRVSTGDECSVIIEDGMIQGAPAPAVVESRKPVFTAGAF